MSCKQRLKGFLKFSGMLLVILLLCLIPSISTASPKGAEPEGSISEAEASDWNTNACKGLKPFSSLDELLYQFYINLESDCLFAMPAAELEKKWDIKILDKERRKPKAYYPLSETEFYYKPYRSDAFYIELASSENDKTRNIFLIKITKEYYEKHGTLFPEGKFSKLIPNFFTNDLKPETFFWDSYNNPIGITLKGEPKIIEIRLFNIVKGR